MCSNEAQKLINYIFFFSMVLFSKKSPIITFILRDLAIFAGPVASSIPSAFQPLFVNVLTKYPEAQPTSRDLALFFFFDFIFSNNSFSKLKKSKSFKFLLYTLIISFSVF